MSALCALCASPPWALAFTLVATAVPGAILGALACAPPSVEMWAANVVAATCGWIVLALRRAIGPRPAAALYLPTLAAAFAWIDLVLPRA
jgi:hydrogenase/urease accessory protein HupE